MSQDRLGRLIATIAVIGLLVFAWYQDRENNQAEQRLHDAERAREALTAQVEALGAEPVEPPDGSDTPIVIAPGPPGPRGPQGPPGRDGRDGAPCDASNPFCIGPQGPQGPEGESIVGPTGEPGESVVGPAGPAGPQGEPGATGPAPASFTFSDGGRTWICSDPDGDLNYTCEQTEPPPAELLP